MLERQENVALWLFHGKVAVWLKCKTHGVMQKEGEVGKENYM